MTEARSRVHGTPGASLMQGTELDAVKSAIGAAGERMTAQELDKIVDVDPHAHVFHSVKLPGQSWDIDHVLVTKEAGRLVISVIDSKRWKGGSHYHFEYNHEIGKHVVLRDREVFGGGTVSAAFETESLMKYLSPIVGGELETVEVRILLVIDNDVAGITYGARMPRGNRVGSNIFLALPLTDLFTFLTMDKNVSPVIASREDALHQETVEGYMDGARNTTVDVMKGLVAWQTAPPVSNSPVMMNYSSALQISNHTGLPYYGDETNISSPSHTPLSQDGFYRNMQQPSRVPLGIGIVAVVLNSIFLLFCPLLGLLGGIYAVVSGLLMAFGIGRTKLNITATILGALAAVGGVVLTVIVLIGTNATM